MTDLSTSVTKSLLPIKFRFNDLPAELRDVVIRALFKTTVIPTYVGGEKQDTSAAIADYSFSGRAYNDLAILSARHNLLIDYKAVAYEYAKFEIAHWAMETGWRFDSWDDPG